MLLNRNGIRQSIKSQKLPIPLCCLVFGIDQGGVFLTVNSIISYLNTKDICYFSYGQLQEIQSEVYTNNIFKCRKIIVIKNIPANPQKEIINIIDQNTIHSIIMVSAELKKNALIRTKFEKSSYNIAVNCYYEDQKQRVISISNTLDSLNINYESNLPTLISQIVERDSLVLKNELEKILLYYSNSKSNINSNIVLSLLSPDYNFHIYEMGAAICHPHTKSHQLTYLLHKVSLMQINYTVIIRMLQQYILYTLQAKQYSNIQEAFQKFSFPIFGQQRLVFTNIVKIQSQNNLLSLLKSMLSLEVKMKSLVINDQQILFAQTLLCEFISK